VEDCIVVGLGGAGSSASYYLARSGHRVLGLEQFGRVHPNGSSHGESRIFRTVQFEGVQYAPLALRALTLWKELESVSARTLLRRTGGLFIGRATGPFLRQSLRASALVSARPVLLGASEVHHRFPQFRLARGEAAIFDPNAGVLFPEECVRTFGDAALREGASLHTETPVESWSADSDSVTVRTKSGDHRARSLVLTAGPWTNELLPDLSLPLNVERQFVYWFPAKADPGSVRASRMPVFVWDKDRTGTTYGTPDLGHGVKVGSLRGKVAQSPETADRRFDERDARSVRRFVRTSFPGLAPREQSWESCLFTNAVDKNFVIGRHPRYPHVIVVTACSGHGFKFVSVLGEIVSHLVRNENVGLDLSGFDVNRFRTRRTRTPLGG
jgi:sarcosine oxidase